MPIDEAASKGTTILYLLSDAGQKDTWKTVRPHLTKGKTLYFSHGFAIVFKDQTEVCGVSVIKTLTNVQVVPPSDIDVILVAPKGSGTTVRSLFLEGKGINSSYAVFQDHSGMSHCISQKLIIKRQGEATSTSVGSSYRQWIFV